MKHFSRQKYYVFSWYYASWTWHYTQLHNQLHTCTHTQPKIEQVVATLFSEQYCSNAVIMTEQLLFNWQYCMFSFEQYCSTLISQQRCSLLMEHGETCINSAIMFCIDNMVILHFWQVVPVAMVKQPSNNIDIKYENIVDNLEHGGQLANIAFCIEISCMHHCTTGLLRIN